MTHQRVGTSQSPSYDQSSPRPIHKPCRFTAILFMAFAFFGLALNGCDIGDTLWDLIHTEGDAEAQIFPTETERVRTFVINTNSFRIETENDDDQTPSVTVTDNVTEYTMQSNGSIRFDEANGDSNLRFDVENGDRIIERPGSGGSGTLTIVDSSPSTPATQN